MGILIFVFLNQINTNLFEIQILADKQQKVNEAIKDILYKESLTFHEA